MQIYRREPETTLKVVEFLYSYGYTKHFLGFTKHRALTRPPVDGDTPRIRMAGASWLG